jgi:hypothetical protein
MLKCGISTIAYLIGLFDPPDWSHESMTAIVEPGYLNLAWISCSVTAEKKGWYCNMGLASFKYKKNHIGYTQLFLENEHLIIESKHKRF